MSDNNVHGSPLSSVTMSDSPPRQVARSPCAACKQSRRRCPPDCALAPVFPQNQSHKFTYVHRVYGVSNVAKLLTELQPHQRAAAAESLVYEAETRLHSPASGSFGIISLLQQDLRGLQLQLAVARAELSRYQRAAVSEGGPGFEPGMVKDEADHKDWEKKTMVMGHDVPTVMAAMRQGAAMNASAVRNRPSRGLAGPSGAQDDEKRGTKRLLDR